MPCEAGHIYRGCVSPRSTAVCKGSGEVAQPAGRVCHTFLERGPQSLEGGRRRRMTPASQLQKRPVQRPREESCTFSHTAQEGDWQCPRARGPHMHTVAALPVFLSQRSSAGGHTRGPPEQHASNKHVHVDIWELLVCRLDPLRPQVENKHLVSNKLSHNANPCRPELPGTGSL